MPRIRSVCHWLETRVFSWSKGTNEFCYSISWRKRHLWINSKIFWRSEVRIPLGLNHGLRTPRESFFSKIWNFWAWADKLGCNFMMHFGYFWPNYKCYFATVSPLSIGKSSASLSYKKIWFLGLKHITPKYSQNKILAVKNLGNSVHTSVFGVPI